MIFNVISKWITKCDACEHKRREEEEEEKTKLLFVAKKWNVCVFEDEPKLVNGKHEKKTARLLYNIVWKVFEAL